MATVTLVVGEHVIVVSPVEPLFVTSGVYGMKIFSLPFVTVTAWLLNDAP